MKVISILPRSEGKRQAYEKKVVRTNRVNVETAELVQCLLYRLKDLS